MTVNNKSLKDPTEIKRKKNIRDIHKVLSIRYKPFPVSYKIQKTSKLSWLPPT